MADDNTGLFRYPISTGTIIAGAAMFVVSVLLDQFFPEGAAAWGLFALLGIIVSAVGVLGIGFIIYLRWQSYTPKQRNRTSQTD
jgi:drug/metabolite transporter (DMT)-like permease